MVDLTTDIVDLTVNDEAPHQFRPLTYDLAKAYELSDPAEPRWTEW